MQISYYASNYYFFIYLQKVLNVNRNPYVQPMYNNHNLKLRNAKTEFEGPLSPMHNNSSTNKWILMILAVDKISNKSDKYNSFAEL